MVSRKQRRKQNTNYARRLSMIWHHCDIATLQWKEIYWTQSKPSSLFMKKMQTSNMNKNEHNVYTTYTWQRIWWFSSVLIIPIYNTVRDDDWYLYIPESNVQLPTPESTPWAQSLYLFRPWRPIRSCRWFHIVCRIQRHAPVLAGPRPGVYSQRPPANDQQMRL